MSASVVVLVPVYLPRLHAIEEFGMDRSLTLLRGRDVRLIAPEWLDVTYYTQRYPQLTLERFASPAFGSIEEYNRMLLSETFYARFVAFEFMLVLQTDAVLLKDDLDYWCAQQFDYVGAPWPDPFELMVKTGVYVGGAGRHVRTSVGNGGLSLRRSAKCISLINEYSAEAFYFRRSGSSEDLFFSVFGSISDKFLIPDEITASRFSMEGRPSYYLRLNGGHMPMGAHAWMKNESNFWLRVMPDAARHIFPQVE